MSWLRKLPQAAAHPTRRAAFVLVIVLTVIVILTLAAYTYTDLMLAHNAATRVTGTQTQARALVDSGIDSARLFFSLEASSQLEAGGLFHNPDRFQAINIVPDEDPYRRGNFSIVSPISDEDGIPAGVRFGWEDESVRLNLNTLLLADATSPDAARDLLLSVPGMLPETADAILDWIDEDDEVREYGAEVDYYSSLDPPYAPRNGPLQSVEELLLVRDVTPQLLFGADVNRNGMLDSHETQFMSQLGDQTGLDDESTGLLVRGWSSYLTLYSKERNTDSTGAPRIYINGEDLETLFDELADALGTTEATFIVAKRQGQYTGSIDFSRPGETMFGQVLDLVGASPVPGSMDADDLPSPFPEASAGAYLPKLMDVLTVNPAESIPGRININQASAIILAGLPGMNDELLDEILAEREAETDEDDGRDQETWLLLEGLVTLDEMKALMPFVCAGGDVYRAQAVGYFEGGGPSARSEVIIDATASTPRLVFWRDISHLGRGYSLETLGLRGMSLQR